MSRVTAVLLFARSRRDPLIRPSRLVAPGMPIAGDRRTDPGRRCERGRLLPRVFGSKALVRVRMHDIRLRYPGIRDAAFADGGLISTDGTRGRHARSGHLPLRKVYRHPSPHHGANQEGQASRSWPPVFVRRASPCRSLCGPHQTVATKSKSARDVYSPAGIPAWTRSPAWSASTCMSSAPRSYHSRKTSTEPTYIPRTRPVRC